MGNKNNLLNKRLQEIQKSKEEAQKNKPEVVQTIVTGKEEKPDFVKMAEELNQSTRSESINDGYKKDTIYIKRELYEAMQALCKRQGDKKDHINRAYEMYLTHIYNEMKEK